MAEWVKVLAPKAYNPSLASEIYAVGEEHWWRQSSSDLHMRATAQAWLSAPNK